MFYKLSWNGQLLAATTLFVISFLIEAEVLRRFLEDPLLAYPLAAALELSKALTIVLGRYFKSRGELHYPATVRLVQTVFRAGLLLLSFGAAAFYFATWADRPNLDQVRAADLARLEGQLQVDREALAGRFEAERRTADEALTRRHARLVQQTEQDFRSSIADLERRLADEMRNRDAFGNFKGPRYRELAARLEETRQAYQERLDRLGRSQGEEAARLAADLEARRRAEAAALRERFETRREALLAAEYADDARAYDPLVNSAVAMAREVLGATVSPLQLTFGIAILMSLLTELGIWAGLEIVALRSL